MASHTPGRLRHAGTPGQKPYAHAIGGQQFNQTIGITDNNGKGYRHKKIKPV